MYLPYTQIPTYGFNIVLGIFIAFTMAYLVDKKNKLDINDTIIIVAVMLLFGFIGAKLLFIVLEFRNVTIEKLKDMQYIKSILYGGFVFYGGLIGGVIGFMILRIGYKKNIYKLLNYHIFMVPVCHGFGRIGCFYASCCFGIPYKGIFSHRYKNALFAPNNVPLFPVQLLEAILNFILGVFLFWRAYNGKDKNNIYIYFISYGLIRFFIEFLRGDIIRGFIFGISTSQFLSIIILIITFMIYIINNFININKLKN